jgi:hypothetical protein
VCNYILLLFGHAKLSEFISKLDQCVVRSGVGRKAKSTAMHFVVSNDSLSRSTNLPRQRTDVHVIANTAD